MIFFLTFVAANAANTVSTELIDTAASDAYFALVVTDDNGRNLFPRNFPDGVKNYYGDTKNARIVLSASRSAYIEGNLDPNLKGQYQVAIISPLDGEKYSKFKIHLFNQRRPNESFYLYRMDITDGRYLSKRLRGLPMPNYKSIVISECFQRRTRFTRAFEVAKKYWDAVKNHRRTAALAMCSDPDPEDYDIAYMKPEYNIFIQTTDVKSYLGAYSNYDREEIITIFTVFLKGNTNIQIAIDKNYKVRHSSRGCGS